MINSIIIDFDSTIINAEGLELVIRAALQRCPEDERRVKLESLAELTESATTGAVPLSEAFRKRFSLARITAEDVEQVAKSIRSVINPLVRETIDILKKRNKTLFIFSSSFEELVHPVADELGIPLTHVFTNKLRYDANGEIAGLEEDNPLFLSMGKVYIAEQLKKEGRLLDGTAVVGDGFSDLSIRKNNIAKMFVYFSGTRLHEVIRIQADFAVDRFDQLLPLFCSNDEVSNETADALTIHEPSAPQAAPSVLLLESIHEKARSKLIEAGFAVQCQKEAWSEQELEEGAAAVNVLGIRSRTRVTAAAISQLPDLWVIGAFCIGTNQIDLAAAANAGIPVFNAPYSNTRSVAELVVGETIMLLRRTFEKSSAAHRGEWMKGARGCSEIRGKTVGIIGYGRIGSQVSVLLENLGMSVVFHDIVDKLPLGNARRAENLDALLERSDLVTLHVPDTPQTRGLIGREQIARMKQGAFLINSSRGFVVDLQALREALDDGVVAGAAIDVFPEEPVNPSARFASPLQGAANVILTPHIGGSTQEAQENIAHYVSEKISKFCKTGSTIGAVNYPEIELPRVDGTHRILHVHLNVPGVLAKINSVFARRNINVEGQLLKTHNNIGYLIVDVDRDISEHVHNLMKAITETIKVRRII